MKRNIITLAALLNGGYAAFLDNAQRPLFAPPHASNGPNKHTANTGDIAPDLEQYITDLMERWHVPGLAVAIIRGNDTWAKGFGYASLPSTPVTPETLFWTGSTTKSHTAAAMALLIDNSTDESSVKWNTPISTLLPEEFVLSDEWATKHITIEDALSHRTGYPRHDLATSKSPEEVVRRLRHLPMSAEPRAKFQYNNHMFATIGYLISKISNMSLGEFLHTYLWGPMGLNHTFLGAHDPRYKASGLHVADGYYYKNSTGEYIKQPLDDESGDEGAGAIISNVLDYATYLRTMMSEGGPISKNGHRELKTPRSFYSRTGPPWTGPTVYFAGWASGIFQDEQVWFHGGWVTMFRTEMLMIPSKNIGIVVVENYPVDVVQIVLYRILYDLFGIPQQERFDHEAAFREQERLVQQQLETCPERLYPNLPSPVKPPTKPLPLHTGLWFEQGYGSLIIVNTCDGKEFDHSALHPCNVELGLRLRMPEDQVLQFYVDLQHMTGDKWIGWGYIPSYEDDQPQVCIRVEFRVDDAGRVAELGVDFRMEGEDGPLVWFTHEL